MKRQSEQPTLVPRLSTSGLAGGSELIGEQRSELLKRVGLARVVGHQAHPGAEDSGGERRTCGLFAGDRVEENLNPVGRAYYAGSTLMCTPCSLAQEVGLALGAQAGEARIRAVVTGGGFTRFRRAMQSPFNLVYEARP